MDWIDPEQFLELWQELKRRTNLVDGALAAQLGIGRSRIVKYREGETRKVNPHVLNKIRKVLHLNAVLNEHGQWVITEVENAEAPRRLYVEEFQKLNPQMQKNLLALREHLEKHPEKDILKLLDILNVINGEQ